MNKTNPVSDLVECSKVMLNDAEQGRWSRVAQAEEQRRDLLNRLFSTCGEMADIPDINKAIEQIIAINKKLEQIALSAREEARIDLKKVREGRLAVNSYAKHI